MTLSSSLDESPLGNALEEKIAHCVKPDSPNADHYIQARAEDFNGILTD